MTTVYRPRGSIIDSIEQSIARGDPIDRICTDLHVTPSQVAKVRRHMDEAVADDVTLAEGNCEIAPSGRIVNGHGTHARYNQHRAAGETPCAACRAAESQYSAARKRRGRAA